jgi:hypothetical protein
MGQTTKFAIIILNGAKKMQIIIKTTREIFRLNSQKSENISNANNKKLAAHNLITLCVIVRVFLGLIFLVFRGVNIDNDRF